MTKETEPEIGSQGVLASPVPRAVPRLARRRTCPAPSACRSPRNAEAAQRAAQEPGAAAIAGQAAGSRYGLEILARNIEDEPNNTTRFLVLGQHEAAPSGRDKTSLVMSARNEPGAVHELLTPLAAHGVSHEPHRIAPGARAHGAVGIPLLRRHRGPREGRERRRGARARCAAKRRYLKILGSYPAAVRLNPC